MNILKTLLIVLLVYFALKFLLKLLMPYLMRYLSKKAEQKFKQAFGAGTYQSSETRKEGSVTIDKMPSSQQRSNDKVGEYVDFEEID